MISSVSELLPAPPVPVMPRTGVSIFAARPAISAAIDCGSVPLSRQEIRRAITPVWAASSAFRLGGGAAARSTSAVASMSAIMPGSPSFWPS